MSMNIAPAYAGSSSIKVTPTQRVGNSGTELDELVKSVGKLTEQLIQQTPGSPAYINIESMITNLEGKIKTLRLQENLEENLSQIKDSFKKLIKE